MTATSSTAVSRSQTRPSASRARWLNVVRLHLANPVPMFVIPLGITAVIFGVNYAIWAMVASAAGGAANLDEGALTYNGGITWIFIFLMVVGVQAVTHTFRFALGFSATRREYYLGTLVFFVLMSVVHSSLLAVMASIERATGGWGLDGAFFAPWGLGDASIATVWLVYFAGMLLAFAVGFVVAGIWMRWRAYGLYAFFIVVAALGVAAAWWITSQGLWEDAFAWLGEQSLTAMALWSLIVTVVCVGLGWTILRKATPRS